MDHLVHRIFRAAKLDANLYEEVEADKSALSQALIVVVLSSLAAGIGSISDAGLGGLPGAQHSVVRNSYIGCRGRGLHAVVMRQTVF